MDNNYFDLTNKSPFVYDYKLVKKAENKTFEKTDSFVVMQRAAKECYSFIKKNFKFKKILIICGQGNNGGDGVIIANHLLNEKYCVEILYPNGKPKSLDSKKAFSLLSNKNCIKTKVNFTDYDVIIDALFGIGLNKSFNKQVTSLINQINSSQAQIISIDIPSGVFADNGQISNTAIKAKYTLSLHRFKTGQWLLPGKKYCGNNVLLDIGLESLDNESYVKLNLFKFFPRLTSFDHKYSRGTCLVIAGENLIGASKLAVLSASKSILRAGAGVCKLLVHNSQMNFFKTHILEEMILSYNDINQFRKIIEEQKCDSIVYGCGTENNLSNKKILKFLLTQPKNLVLDAVVFTLIQEDRDEFMQMLQSRSAQTVMTPHLGEFKRVFSLTNSKINDCLKAAKASNAVIVLKGNDTVIGSKDGIAYLNTYASSYLATAGSGDVLAGLIGSFLSQGLSDIKAARLGCYIHSQCSLNLGFGLIASDLVKEIPKVIKKMESKDLISS